jgi:TPR repeat protein
MNFNGEGMPKNYLEAATKWFRLAADKGEATSLYNLAVLYYQGYGVAKDKTVAIKLFSLAAEKGHPMALECLQKIASFGPRQ